MTFYSGPQDYPIQDGPLWGNSWMGEGMDRWGQKGLLPKICHTYPTMIQFGTVIPCLKKIYNIYEYVIHPLSSADFTGNLHILL